MAKRTKETTEAAEQGDTGIEIGTGSPEIEIDAQAIAETFERTLGTGSGEGSPPAAAPETEAKESEVLLVTAKRSNYIPVAELTPEQREERKRRNKEYRDRKRTRAVGGFDKQKKQAEETALALLVITNQLVAFYFGRECEMSEIEREMIEEPLVRMLAKTDPAKMAKVNDYTDPLMLLVGVAAWGSRVYNLRAEQKPKPPQQPGEVKQGQPDNKEKRSSNGKPDYSLTINPAEAMHVSE